MKRTILRTSLLALLSLLAGAGTAHAQATRTWVSGVGDDWNPCSRTAPCRTFAGAIVKTARGGVINVIDPGDFGSVVISSALTIDGRGAGHGDVTASASGIRVAAGAADPVTLRALSIVGSGLGSGVSFVGGKSLTIDDCVISGFTDGIDVQPSAGGTVHLSNVFVTKNAAAGVRARAGGGPVVFASVVGSRFEDNGVGVFAGPGGRLSVYDSVVASNGSGIVAEVDGSGGLAEVNLELVSVSNNDIGVHASAEAGSALVRMSNVLATNNTTSSTARSGHGAILSFGNNRLDVESTIALSSEEPSQSGPAGASVVYPVDAVVTGLLTTPIAFACTGLPQGATCGFAPATVPAESGSAAVEVTVTSTAPKTAMNDGARGPSHPLSPLSLALFAAVPAIVVFGSRRRLRAPLAIVVLASLSSTSACGSEDDADPGFEDDAAVQDDAAAQRDAAVQDDAAVEGDAAVQRDAGVPHEDGGEGFATPPGTYPFTVTATSGSATTSLDLTLVVE